MPEPSPPGPDLGQSSNAPIDPLASLIAATNGGRPGPATLRAIHASASPQDSAYNNPPRDPSSFQIASDTLPLFDMDGASRAIQDIIRKQTHAIARKGDQIRGDCAGGTRGILDSAGIRIRMRTGANYREARDYDTPLNENHDTPLTQSGFTAVASGANGYSFDVGKLNNQLSASNLSGRPIVVVMHDLKNPQGAGHIFYVGDSGNFSDFMQGQGTGLREPRNAYHNWTAYVYTGPVAPHHGPSGESLPALSQIDRGTVMAQDYGKGTPPQVQFASSLRHPASSLRHPSA